LRPAGRQRGALDHGRQHDVAVLHDDGLLGGGLGLDDGLHAVLGLVNDGLDVVLAPDLERALVDDLLLDEGRMNLFVFQPNQVD
jgi:hypothetical protein